MPARFKKIFISGSLAFLFVVLIYISAPWLHEKINWHLAKKAISASGYSYEIGLTKVTMINCYTTGSPPVCTGGTLCSVKDAAQCTNYVDVSGTKAGGKGTNALFMLTATSQAGLTSGGQLIAGGMGPTTMDSGVLASTGGCYNCSAGLNVTEKTLAWLNKYIIAGIRR